MILPPIYCIACEQLPDRREAAASHFAERGLAVTFVQGIHGESWGLDTRHCHAPGVRITPGHIGLILSHWMLWQHLWLSGVAEALILEDDAIIPADFPARFTALMAAVPAETELVFV